jgi:peptidoglycan/LPS O-acetylase OafA/YrhL
MATLAEFGALVMYRVWRIKMSIGTILLIIVILLLIGAIPAWPHSRQWGYGPSGGLGLVLVVLLILFLLGKI